MPLHLIYTIASVFSDILFKNSKLNLTISWGLCLLNPPSRWGFDKPEVQIPTYPPMLSAPGVVGLDIDRCIIISYLIDQITHLICSTGYVP